MALGTDWAQIFILFWNDFLSTEKLFNQTNSGLDKIILQNENPSPAFLYVGNLSTLFPLQKYIVAWQEIKRPLRTFSLIEK